MDVQLSQNISIPPESITPDSITPESITPESIPHESIPPESIFIPPDFYCPITGSIMIDPVSDNGGHTYERDSIVQWLQTNKTSPITREYLDESLLTDNVAMKRSIESIRDKLTSDQLKVDSQIMDVELLPYVEKLDEITIDQYYNEGKLVVSITGPDVVKRPPIDIVLCIDVSYSMYDEATLKGTHNERLSHGMSVLSLTLSAAKTILYTLDDDDNISIVTYSSGAKTVVKGLPCSRENKALISSALDSLKPLSNTNMWAGMIESLDILKDTSPPNKNKGIILLTDGVPNVEPPRGHETMLQRYFDENDFRCMISCYGFGYNLNSELLLNISNISGGDGYSFIPDASILGSVFINGISNLLLTCTTNVNMKINLGDGSTITNGPSEINIDSLKYGKTKHFVFDVDVVDTTVVDTTVVDTTVVDTTVVDTTVVDTTVVDTTVDERQLRSIAKVTLTLPNGKTISSVTNTCDEKLINRQLFRMGAVKTINHCLYLKKYNDDSFKDSINEFQHKMLEYNSVANDPYIQNILDDFSGQVKEALNMTNDGMREDWFSRWGIHYLRSLQGAYKNELCNNFKDKGLLNFKSGLFDILCDNISTVFEAIPPPKPDIVKQAYRGSTNLRSMSVYNNAGGGCCIGTSGVLMANKNTKEIQHIKKGDKVITCDPNNLNEQVISEVECLVFTESPDYKESLSTVQNNTMSLSLTPYHPILNNEDRWIHPCTLSPPLFRACRGVYTLVVKNRYPVIVQGFVYATLGHNIQGPVIGHPFFGTNKVINDLKRFNTFTEGFVELKKANYIRSDGLVVEISG